MNKLKQITDAIQFYLFSLAVEKEKNISCYQTFCKKKIKKDLRFCL